jgi:quercetin dioxygenase-like cupin family protein
MATVIALEDLRRSPTACLFEGGDEVPVSSFITQYGRGQAVGLHTHPYPEVFVVLDGTGRFTVGDEQLTVTGGHVLVVPAEAAHGFEGAGDDTLRVVSIHPNGHVIQTDL